MTIKRSQFSSIVKNAQQIKNLFEISIVSYTYEDVLNGVTSTIEVEVEPFYQPKINQGDFLEFKLKYEDVNIVNNSGTLRVDDVVAVPGVEEFYSIGATAYDYTERKPDDRPITYNGSILVDVITNQADYFELEYEFPFVLNVLARDARAGLYVAESEFTNDAIREIDAKFRQQGHRIFEISADNRIEVLKKVADMYGFIFNMKLGKLFFYAWDFELKQRPSVLTITPDKLVRYSEFREKTTDIFGKASVLYAVIRGGRIVDIQNVIVTDTATSQVAKAEYIPPTSEIFPGQAEAILRGMGLLIKRNADRKKCFLTLEGEPGLKSGQAVNLSGFDSGVKDVNPEKNNDGKWIIVKATQKLNAQGWFTELELWKADNTNLTF